MADFASSLPNVGQARSRKIIVAGIFAAAIVLGVVAALVIRAIGTDPAPPVTTNPPTGSIPPGPIEAPDFPAGPFATTIRTASSGTHRIVALTCSGTGVGTAFQVGSEGLLATSVRSVSAARSIAIMNGDRAIGATVAKIDTRSGLALLQPVTPVAGRTFELGTRQLAVNDEAALIGWTTESQQPARGRLRGAVGTISETGVTVDSPDGQHTSVRRMTGDFDAGLAGSPVIGADGLLIGVAIQATDAQRGLLIAGLDTIADPLLGPTGMPPAMEPCLTAAGPQIVTTVGGSAPTATRTELGQLFGALNAADWDRARGTLAPSLKDQWPRERLETEFRGHYAFGILAAPSDNGTTLVSWTQLAAEGTQRCERQLARVTLDRSGIQTISFEGDPVPCV